MIADEKIVGESRETIPLTTSDEHRSATINLVDQAQSTIDILSYNLEPKIYNSRLFVSSLRSFAVRNKRTQVRILIHSSRSLVLNGHQVIDLAQQLSSYVTIKKLSQEDLQLSQGYIIADSTAIILRREAMRYEGTLNFNDRATCRKLIPTFEKAWHHATLDPELRRLYI